MPEKLIVDRCGDNDIDTIIRGIIDAQEELLKSKIVANSVMIDNKYVKVKQFFWSDGFNCYQSPMMIGGLKAKFTDLPDDVAFYVFKKDGDNEPSRSELEEQIAEMAEKLNKIKELLGD